MKFGMLVSIKFVPLTVSGGRFKKEVIIDGQSYLLLIRDEGGAPEMQVRTGKTCILDHLR